MGAREEKNGMNGAPASVLLGVWVVLLEVRASREEEKKKVSAYVGVWGEQNKEKRKMEERKMGDGRLLCGCLGGDVGMLEEEKISEKKRMEMEGRGRGTGGMGVDLPWELEAKKLKKRKNHRREKMEEMREGESDVGGMGSW